MIKENKYRRTYSKDFKLKAVKMKLEQECSNKMVVEALGLPSPRMFRHWVSNYRKYGEAGNIGARCRPGGRGSGL